MFCQQCGAELLSETKFCVKCGHKLRTEPRISNKILLIMGIAALISVGSALLSFFPRDRPIQAQAEPSPTIITPSPRASPTPKPTQKPQQTPKFKPTPDYPYRHTPTLIYPDDGALFSYVYSSGKIVFRWESNAASEADRYKIELEYGNPSHLPPWLFREFETPWNYYTVQFTGMKTTEVKGRWRVKPIFADGREGMPTNWRTFHFTR